MSLLDVKNLTVSVDGQRLVNDVSFSLDRGQRLGIIGESGSGKTLTALAILGLLADSLSATGSITLDGRQLLGKDEESMCAVRGDNISMIFQEPMTALNPVMRIGRQVAEPLRLHRGLDNDDALKLAVELLNSVGIEHADRRARSYPHELSGGQRQRAMIAMALACGPDLVIADEPTTALDVTVQAQVLSVLRDQVLAHHTALILITHDLPVVASMTDEVVVLRDGEVVDRGPTDTVFEGATSPYTAELVASVPPMSRSATAEGKPPGEPPVGTPLVRVRDLHKDYKLRRTSLLDARPIIKALHGVSVDIHAGETFGIVGESGSGKST
ncbi:MAG: ATP-binding cassette domain-containing protein, partial [Acidimicrobiia bacterium]|nr:ATP-binding cassette domain-containing protein [Acidimicrobiia bacterium]